MKAFILLSLFFISVSAFSQCGGVNASGTAVHCDLTVSRHTIVNTIAIDSVLSGLWLGSSIPVSKGGTGATTTQGLIDNVIPSQTGNSGKILTTDGSNLSWANSSSSVTSVGLSSTDLSVSGSPITSSGSITANLSTTGVTAGTYDWVTVDSKGRVTAGANSPVPTAIASGARNFNQAYQLSSSRPATIKVSAQISCNLSLTSGESGQIILEISPNGTSGWIFSDQISGSNTGTLTIGLNTTQITGAGMSEDLPIGYYWRLRTNNVSGTPTYTFNGGNEKIF